MAKLHGGLLKNDQSFKGKDNTIIPNLRILLLNFKSLTVHAVRLETGFFFLTVTVTRVFPPIWNQTQTQKATVGIAWD